MLKTLQNGLIGSVTGKNANGGENNFKSGDMLAAQGVGAAAATAIFTLLRGRLPWKKADSAEVGRNLLAANAPAA